MLRVALALRHPTCPVEKRRLVAAAKAVLQGEGIAGADLSLAVVDDPTIHGLNRQYLQHDYPTDVLSFVLESTPELLEGEIVVSGDTAVAQAGEYSSTPEEELMLYVIHGTLHLVGFDDHEEADEAKMRHAEQDYLRASGLPSGTE